MTNLPKNSPNTRWNQQITHILLNRLVRCAGCHGCNYSSSEMDEEGHCGTCNHQFN